jgi:hypothetical protein
LEKSQTETKSQIKKKNPVCDGGRTVSVWELAEVFNKAWVFTFAIARYNDLEAARAFGVRVPL